MKYYGAAYYPEQETVQDVEHDAREMKDIGFNVVRLGEFAWSKFEPADGVFDFTWFDQALQQLDRQGIAAVLCTPTACPPAWMIEKHPEILYRDNRGVVRPFGGRRHYCYNQPVYRRYCARISREIATRYGAAGQVIGFHIDNELGQEGTGRCHCAVCQDGFRSWLKKRYGDIATFNRLAGTIFWSQTYDRFEQVLPPVKTIEPTAVDALEWFVDNPTLRLDWERYCSDSITAFQNQQAGEIRTISSKPITTNATGFWTNANDLYASFATLDVAGGDVYPSLRSNDMYGATCDFAFHRGLKAKNFWVLETSSGGGQGVWARQGIPQPFPGALHQNALLAYACDADLCTYFQYKTFRYGAEQLEAAVIDIDGVPRRRYREFQRAAKDLAELTPLLEASRVLNQVAIVFDYDSLWAIKIKPFSRGFSYQGQVQQIYAGLAQHGIGCDVVGLSEAIRAYAIVILPTPVILSEAAKRLLIEYVRGGGTLLTNFLAGIKDPYNTAPRQSVPAGLVELFGMRVGEGEPVSHDAWQDTAANVRLEVGGEVVEGKNHIWTESLELRGAEVIGRYQDSYRQGEPVATRHGVGRGQAIYLGTWLEDEALLARLLAQLARSAGVTPAPFRFPRGVEAIRRRWGDRDLFFLFNYREQPVTIDCTGSFTDLRTKRTLGGTVAMTAKETLVLTPA